MRKPPGIETDPARIVRVLSVSPIKDDHVTLAQIFSRSEWTMYTGAEWILATSFTLESALSALEANSIPIVLCECSLERATWREMLKRVTLLPDPPFLIVTSRLADDRLWAEALNLGAYDVLAKPFDMNEVIRTVSFAWLHWKDQQENKRQELRERRAVEQWNSAAG